MSKYYPLNPEGIHNYKSDPNFTGFNNVSYQGDSLTKYDYRATTLSNEDIIVNLNQYNPIESQVTIPATFSNARQTPLLPYRADAYKICCHSVYVPESSIYLFEWNDTITPANSIVPYDKYTVTVTYWDGIDLLVTETRNLTFTPYNMIDYANGIQQVFEIDQCIISLNGAYESLFTSMNIPFAPPKFVLDKNTSLIGFYASTDYNLPSGANGKIPNPTDWVEDAGSPYVKLGWNYWVNSWFDSTFSSVKIGKNIDGNQSNQLRIYDNGNPASIVTINGDNYYNFWQSNSSTDLFSTVEKVVIVSSIQTRPQYTSITAFNSITNIVPNTMQSINILLDFPYTITSFNNAESSKPIIYQAVPHMWQDILTQDTLNLLSYSIFVQRTNGVLSQVLLNPGQMMSVKLLFRLK